MNPEPESRFMVTAEDLLRYKFNEVIRGQTDKECTHYVTPFAQAARDAAATGDQVGERVYALFHAVTSFHPNFEERGNPFGPMMTEYDGRRTLIAEDLVDVDLEALTGVYESVEDAELRARISDILWECRKDYKAAQVAVTAYLLAAESHKTDDLWPTYEERLRRAAQISAKIGYKKPLHVEAIGLVENALTQFENNPKSGLLCETLIRILLAHNLTSPNRHGVLAERLANEFAQQSELHFSHRYWQVAVEVYRDAKDAADVQRCQLAAAEALVSIAEEGLGENKNGYGYAAHWLARGLQALREARATPARIKAIHQQLLDAQRQALNEMVPLELDINKTPGVSASEKGTQEKSAQHVSGFSFEEALARFVHVARPTDAATLSDQIDKHNEQFVFSRLMGSNALDRSGKVVDYIPPAGQGSTEDQAVGKRKRMVQMARQVNWNLRVGWQIEPARRRMIQEHPIRWEQLAPLVRNNPLIPPHHAGIFIRGFQSGFFGDWLVAMNLLVPQVEAMLRYALQQNGVITSTLEQDGTQKERDLNQLLWLPEVEEILGPDLHFDFRGILIERFGYNMRNESAHGLMGESDFYCPAAPLLWWLMLRLCWLGFRLASKQNEETPS